MSSFMFVNCLLHRLSIFRPIEDDLTVFHNGESVRALIEQGVTLQYLVIINNPSVQAAQFAYVEADIIGSQGFQRSTDRFQSFVGTGRVDEDCIAGDEIHGKVKVAGVESVVVFLYDILGFQGSHPVEEDLAISNKGHTATAPIDRRAIIFPK